MANDCGYQLCRNHHRGVSFISRYRGQNDYCVDGLRVTTDDNDGVLNATPEQAFKLRLFLLQEYADYCMFHADLKAKNGDYCPELSALELPRGLSEVLR